jgi:dextranase
LIEDTKARLNEITLENHQIFNNVGNWPVKSVAKVPLDAVYIEVWEPNREYHLR